MEVRWVSSWALARPWVGGKSVVVIPDSPARPFWSGHFLGHVPGQPVGRFPEGRIGPQATRAVDIQERTAVRPYPFLTLKNTNPP